MDRVILHCDLEQLLRLGGTAGPPGAPGQTGGGVRRSKFPPRDHRAKNEPAKRYKVQTAETIWQARRKCPELVLLPAHHWKYRDY